MEKSETIGKLAAALGQFQKAMPAVHKDSVNPFFQHSYATLPGLIKAAGALLPEHGLSVTQVVESGGAVTTLLLHSSGEYIGGTLELRPTKDDPQGRGSAITYARRYSYASILGLVTDGDDDGNAGSKSPDLPPAGQTRQAKPKTGEKAKPPNPVFDTKVASEKMTDAVVAKSTELHMTYSRADAKKLIRLQIKSAGLSTPLKTPVDFDMAQELAIGALVEIAEDKRGE